jgi:transposase-like protein
VSSSWSAGLLEGIRAELSVAELCRREGIHPTVYYTWLKDFMEAGKARMRGDSLRDATTVEVRDLRQENERLKQLVAELSLVNLTLRRAPPRCLGANRRPLTGFEPNNLARTCQTQRPRGRPGFALRAALKTRRRDRVHS